VISSIKKVSDIKINVTHLKYIKYRKKNYINVTDRNCELMEDAIGLKILEIKLKSI